MSDFDFSGVLKEVSDRFRTEYLKEVDSMALSLIEDARNDRFSDFGALAENLRALTDCHPYIILTYLAPLVCMVSDSAGVSMRSGVADSENGFFIYTSNLACGAMLADVQHCLSKYGVISGAGGEILGLFEEEEEEEEGLSC